MKGLYQSFLHEFFVSKIHYQRKTGFFPKMVNQNTLRVAEMKRLFNLVHTFLYTRPVMKQEAVFTRTQRILIDHQMEEPWG